MLVGEVIADRYELEELVGTGGMSSVFKARDRMLDRNVALKILHEHYLDDDEYVERFRREARAVAQLSHPNIVTVIDRGEADGRQFIVFEYVDGENLKQLLEREGPLPVAEALELALGIARALSFAHERGLVHRDVKPQNVLLNGDGRPMVTDFGIARSLDVKKSVTQTGTVLGTSNYIAPEQASAERARSAAAFAVARARLADGDPRARRDRRRRDRDPAGWLRQGDAEAHGLARDAFGPARGRLVVRSVRERSDGAFGARAGCRRRKPGDLLGALELSLRRRQPREGR